MYYLLCIVQLALAGDGLKRVLSPIIYSCLLLSLLSLLHFSLFPSGCIPTIRYNSSRSFVTFVSALPGSSAVI